ncbi:MAG TPA: hypothetical protein VGM98_14460 [Schlesneria sp.]|jgi:hypothetical protein
MKLTSFHVACMILTCIVVHTCVRIEVLNARYGYYLPRTDFGSGNPKWRVADEKLFRLREEMMIARSRQEDYQAAHPDEGFPDESAFKGPPYSVAEQATIDAEVDHNRRNSTLRAWVGSMGLLQYVLAPAALFWSLDIVVSDRLRGRRVVAGLCGLLNLICIALMYYRGYWSSLGW